MIRKNEAYATVSRWTADDGKKCARTVQVGTIFESSHGRLVMKLEAVPTARDWSGWLALKPCAAAMPPAPAPEDAPATDEETDIPF